MKPELIIHTHISIDGKINGPHLKTDISQRSQREYYNIFLGKDRPYDKHFGWIEGTTSAEVTLDYRRPDLDESIAEVPEGDFLAETDAEFYYFVLDPEGRLGWEKNYFTYFETSPHVVEILTEQTNPAFKAYLRDLDISYIIAGDDRVDVHLALEKINEIFGLEQLIITGGGGMNWTFLSEGLVDEVSLVVTPIADGSIDSQSLFYSNPKYNEPMNISFKTKDVGSLEDGSLWVRYTVKK